MKVLFIESRRKQNIDINSIDLKILPKEIFLAYSIQFEETAKKIRKKLGKRVKEFRQVLGCSKLKSKHPILLVSSGKFHAINLALQDNTVYMVEGAKINKLDEKEVAKIKGKRRAALSKFYAAEKIGILVSNKPGQENLKKAESLKADLMKKDKEVTIFLTNNINIGELENYPIDSWVNTACQALSFDSKIINIQELQN